MCGVMGAISRSGPVDSRRWEDAQRIQHHRGPDGQGEVQLLANGWTVQFAHQRLAIIDLSAAGHQPMSLDDDPDAGVLVFNGELYNYRELRAELQGLGVCFSTSSDSEVLLRALRHWGIREALARFNGMWAFAWLEPVSRCLWLSRDRAGEKPLYFFHGSDGFYFASELKGLLTLTGGRYTLHTQSVGEFLVQNLLDAGPGCLLDGIERVPAAALMRLDLSGSHLELRAERYWSAPRGEISGDAARSPEECLRELFLDAVQIRLRSDVPVGVLLSGGIDSSAIAAAAHRIVGVGGELNLLSMVSGNPRFDESVHIDRVARALGREPCKVLLDLQPGTAFPLLEQAVWHNDAPVGSFSNVAHLLLMRKARELGVTVVLSGQGADEMLCGYRKYLGFYVQELLRARRWSAATRLLWSFFRRGTVLSQFSVAEGRRYLPRWMRSNDVDLRGEQLRDFVPHTLGLPAGTSVGDRQIDDLERFSIPTLNHFEDRMSMSESREIRLPFLDVRLMEFLLGLPTQEKLGSGWTKHVMRRAIAPWLPAEVVWRRDKQGFINPESEWMKRELRPKVEEYFAPDALIFRHRLVDREKLLTRYASFCAQPAVGGAIWFREIFNPLSLEIWLRRFEASIAAP